MVRRHETWQGLRLAAGLLLLCAAAGAGECRALIVAGDAGHEANSAGRFANWTERWAALLKDKYSYKAANIRVLRCDKKGGADVATQETVLAALADLARDSKDGDQTLLVLLGHGYDSQNVGKLCLPGKDLSDLETARALERLKAKEFICVAAIPASVSWAKALSKPGRTIITAAGTEGLRSQTYFSEFLLRALAPGGVNLLDAYNRAALDTIHWYQNQFVGKDGTRVNGKEYQEIFKTMYPDKPMIAGKAEPVAANNDMRDMEAWLGRRVLPEAAGLEDNGDGTPSTVYEDGKEPQPLPSKSGDGALAKTITLGKL